MNNSNNIFVILLFYDTFKCAMDFFRFVRYIHGMLKQQYTSYIFYIKKERSNIFIVFYCLDRS